MPSLLSPGGIPSKIGLQTARTLLNTPRQVLGRYVGYAAYASGSSIPRALRSAARGDLRRRTTQYTARVTALLAGQTGALGAKLQETAQRLGVQDRVGRLTDQIFDDLVPEGLVDDIANPEQGGALRVDPFVIEPFPLSFSYEREGITIAYTFPYGAQIRVSGSTGVVVRPSTARYGDRAQGTEKERSQTTDKIVTITAVLDSNFSTIDPKEKSSIEFFRSNFIDVPETIAVTNVRLNKIHGITSLVIRTYDFPHSPDYQKQSVILQGVSDNTIRFPTNEPESVPLDVAAPLESSQPLDSGFDRLSLQDIESTV